MKKAPVIDRPKYDRVPRRKLAAEPEMIELKRMIRAGQLTTGRTAAYLKERDRMNQPKPKTPWKQMTIRLPHDVHKALKIRTAEEEKTVGEVVERLIREYLVGRKQA